MGQEISSPVHTPVLLRETIEALDVQDGGRYVDCTVGGGGHAAAILERSSPGGQLLGIDADPEAVKTAQAELIGRLLAKKALAGGVKQVVFDRGGYMYHGRVKALAEGARQEGLKF